MPKLHFRRHGVKNIEFPFCCRVGKKIFSFSAFSQRALMREYPAIVNSSIGEEKNVRRYNFA
jgi:hypothetical protein